MLGLRDFIVPIHDDIASKSKVMQQERRLSAISVLVSACAV
jgi:hypothetical protein